MEKVVRMVYDMKIKIEFMIPLLLSLTFIISNAYATELYIDPQNIVDPSLTPRSNFQIDIMVSDVTDLYAAIFDLSWDPSILELISIERGGFLGGESESLFLTESQIDGYVEGVLYSCLGPVPGNSGSGSVAIATFVVINEGQSVLDLSDTHLLDSTKNEIVHTVTDGNFDNEVTTTTVRRGGGCGRGCYMLGLSNDSEFYLVIITITAVVLVTVLGVLKFFVKRL